MAKFIEVHYVDCEMLINLDTIKRITPEAQGKRANLILIDQIVLEVTESYEEVKALIKAAAVTK